MALNEQVPAVNTDQVTANSFQLPVNPQDIRTIESEDDDPVTVNIDEIQVLDHKDEDDIIEYVEPDSIDPIQLWSGK